MFLMRISLCDYHNSIEIVHFFTSYHTPVTLTCTTNLSPCKTIFLPKNYTPPKLFTHGNQMLQAITSQTKLLFLCSPGNPTAKSIPLSDIRTIASSPSYHGLVIVDEAYVDFSTTPSAVSLVTEFDNVVVLQTLSKAFGLAGIRCGFAIGPSDVIQLMNNVKAPYNVNKLTSDAAANALRNTHVLEKNVKEVLDQREWVAKKLEVLEFVEKVYPSDSNFLLFRVKQKANQLYKTVRCCKVHFFSCVLDD